MSLKAQLEAIIYATETPITLDHLIQLVKAEVLAAGAVDDNEVKSRVRATLEELLSDYSGADHGIEIRQLAGGYRMSTKPEQHDAVRAFAKSLKPPIRLSLPALETLAVIAYKQPITALEVGEIRGVNTSGVLTTLLERHLIKIVGRKNVVGRPFLYATTKEFLIRFGLNDLGDLPKIEDMAEALGFDPPARLIEQAPAEEMLPLEEPEA